MNPLDPRPVMRIIKLGANNTLAKTETAPVRLGGFVVPNVRGPRMSRTKV